MLYFDDIPARILPFMTLSSRDTTHLDFSRKLANDTALVAHENGYLRAAASYAIRSRNLELHIIWVDPKMRGKGLSKDVFRVLLDLRQPEIVRAQALTEEGASFFSWAKKAFPKVEFRVKKIFS